MQMALSCLDLCVLHQVDIINIDSPWKVCCVGTADNVAALSSDAMVCCLPARTPHACACGKFLSRLSDDGCEQMEERRRGMIRKINNREMYTNSAHPRNGRSRSTFDGVVSFSSYYMFNRTAILDCDKAFYAMEMVLYVEDVVMKS